MKTVLNISLIALLACVTFACTTAPKTQTGRDQLALDVDRTLENFRQSDLTIKDHINNAYGYAVFPNVGKGGIGVGGAYGKGMAFERGNSIGYCDLSQATIGAQLGGQAYSELILFEDKAALDRFKTGEYALSAQATAVAAASGAGANARYKDGVMVFTLGESGLMFEASIGGQKFDFQPK